VHGCVDTHSDRRHFAAVVQAVHEDRRPLLNLVQVGCILIERDHVSRDLAPLKRGADRDRRDCFWELIYQRGHQRVHFISSLVNLA
jgi:hypothetical protein